MDQRTRGGSSRSRQHVGRWNPGSLERFLAIGGGRAELRLENPEAPLESGIEVFAQPPGKKLENINLLSGGERSMAALAFLFAAFLFGCSSLRGGGRRRPQGAPATAG
jgi:hypothetical protein